MIALVQRVSEAEVTVGGESVGAIGAGILALIGVERGDGEPEAERLVERVLGYRIFPDAEGKMNLSLADTGGALLAVPQFTLAADTRKGMRPSFTPAAPPDQGAALFEYLVEQTKVRLPQVQSGRFGAHMSVSLLNDGPVTFLLQAN